MTGGACPLCGSGSGTLWKPRNLARALVADDMQPSDARYGITLALWRCEACGFIHAAAADVGELDRLYAEMTDAAYEATQEARALQMRALLATARAWRPGARSLLDVGAGAGLLVREAAARGFAATGVEPSAALVRAGRELNQVELLHGTLPHAALDGRRFDIVALVDVIEHVADPVGLLRRAAAQLAPGGLVLVVTPDIGSVPARLLRHRWWHLRLAHVGYFTRATLRAAAAAASLEVERSSRPRWFFPVDYLVERIGKYLPIGPLLRGLRRTAGLRRLLQLVVPLNPHDSLVVGLRQVAPRPGRSE